MKFKDHVIAAVNSRGTTLKAVWQALGVTEATYLCKLNEDRLTLGEFERIMEYLDYDVNVEVHDMKTGNDTMRKSSSPRFAQRIKGVNIDTSDLEFICRTPEQVGSWMELLRLPEENRYFVAYYSTAGGLCGVQLIEVDKMYAEDFKRECGIV